MGIPAKVKQLLARTKSRVEAVFFSVLVMSGFGLAIFIWLQPWAYRKTGDGLAIGVFPTVSLAGVILFSMICLNELYRDGREKEVVTQGTTPEDDINWGPAIFLAAIGILGSLAIVRFDPLFLSAALGILILALGNVRKWYLLVGTGVGLPLFVYVFMIRLAGIFFPTTWF